MNPVPAENSLAVLADMTTWRLTAQDWQLIDTMMVKWAAAVAARDERALCEAVSAVETAAPRRTTRLGAPSEIPPPRRVRIRMNRLVHSLGGDPGLERSLVAATGPAAGDRAEEDRAEDDPATAFLDRIADQTGVVGRNLVVHLVAPLDGPDAGAALDQIRSVWANVVRQHGLTVAVPGLNLAADIPEARSLASAGPAIAARQDLLGDTQMILRREYDVLVLSILWAGAGGDWAGRDRSWARVSAEGTGALLGAARLYLGEAPADAGDAAAVADRMPHLDGEPWHPVEGVATAEVNALDDGRAVRRILLVAPSGADPQLSAWAWSRGDAHLTPLARHLLQAAKLRYEYRIWQQDAAAVAGAAPEDREPLEVRISRFRDLRLTVDIIRSAMAVRESEGVDFLAEDGDFATWFQQRIEDELGYLDNEQVRAVRSAAESAPAPARALAQTLSQNPTSAPTLNPTQALTIALVTALPEEFTAMRVLIDDPRPVTIPGDPAEYLRGTIPSPVPDRPHHVVLTLLGETGNDAASGSVVHLLRSFPTVDQVVMLGIAAGMPDPDRPASHVRLGDVVAAAWGIFAFDNVVDHPDGRVPYQEFPSPSWDLAQRAKQLAAGEKIGQRPWEQHLDALVHTLPAFARPGAETDLLYADERPDAPLRAHPPLAESGHTPGRPRVHLGWIGSSERSLRNAGARDLLQRERRMQAIEMEGKGVGRAAYMNSRNWFVVRGISDYGDTHANPLWRHYASAVAAAYVRALIEGCRPFKPR